MASSSLYIVRLIGGFCGLVLLCVGSLAVLAEIGAGAGGLYSHVLADHHLLTLWIIFVANTAGIVIIALVIIHKARRSY